MDEAADLVLRNPASSFVNDFYGRGMTGHVAGCCDSLWRNHHTAAEFDLPAGANRAHSYNARGEILGADQPGGPKKAKGRERESGEGRIAQG